jgi:hypothetical protein
VSLPPRQALRRALRLVLNEGRGRVQRARDERAGSWSRPQDVPAGPLRQRLQLDGDALREAALHVHTDDAMAHCFDLLGSGPVVVYHGMACTGVRGVCFPPALGVAADPVGCWLEGRINASNLPESQRVWSLITTGTDSGYVPIDWQLDFRSGFRWSGRTWYRDIEFGRVRGADVKVPWELGRMQHLPRLALVAAGSADAAVRTRARLEMRNQVLDFIATNPPRYGVQWTCAMDVGIRMTNWLLAFDILRAGGAAMDDPFDAVFRRSIFEHSLHVATNLEWLPEERGNHFLANLGALVLAGAYLPRGAAADAWLDYAAGELLSETVRQFHGDGGHFEASTGYHRLSAEIVAYATAALLGLKADEQCAGAHGFAHGDRPPALWPPPARVAPSSAVRFPDEFVRRVHGMAALIRDTADAVGRAALIGDNDGGRFVNLDSLPVIDHSGALAALTAVLHRAGSAAIVVHALARGKVLPHVTPRTSGGRDTRIPAHGGSAPLGSITTAEEAVTPAFRTITRIKPGGPLGSAITTHYPDFGVVVLRAGAVHMTLRVPPAAVHGTSHAHDDALAIELSVGRVRLLSDAGSPFYTPFPELQHAFAAARAHNVPDSPARSGPARVAALDEGGVTARCGRVQRTIRLEADTIVIEDTAESPVVLRFQLGPDVRAIVDGRRVSLAGAGPGRSITADGGRWTVEDAAVSPEYGVLLPAQRLEWQA